jgi:membrane-associated phospholipid phosphatase
MLVWLLVNLVPAIHRADAVVLRAFIKLNRPRVDSPARSLTALFEPVPFIVWGVALVAIALSRRRPWIALAISAVMGLAPLTTEILKPLVAHSHARAGAVEIPPASWPSGHATAALALVLCAVLVTPHRFRQTVAAIGALLALAVGGAQLILARHMPSDIVGGYFVAALWTSLAVALLRVGKLREGEPARG